MVIPENYPESKHHFYKHFEKLPQKTSLGEGVKPIIDFLVLYHFGSVESFVSLWHLVSTGGDSYNDPGPGAEVEGSVSTSSLSVTDEGLFPRHGMDWIFLACPSCGHPCSPGQENNNNKTKTNKSTRR